MSTAAAPTLLRDALLALRYLADLNGSEWIKGADAGSIDMRQRAKAIQARLFASTEAARAERDTARDGRRFFVLDDLVDALRLALVKLDSVAFLSVEGDTDAIKTRLRTTIDRATGGELERTKAQLRAWITPDQPAAATAAPVHTQRDRELLDAIAATKTKPTGWTPPEVADAAATTAIRQACEALVVARIAGETAGYGTDWSSTLAEAIKAAECVRDMS